MNKLLAALLGLAAMLGAVNAQATPEDDRLKLVKLYKEKYPDIKVEDYIYGALAFDPDAKSQYLAIMDFPPYVGEIEKGEKLWKTPFKNGKTYADCLPNGGKMIAGNYPMFDEVRGKVVTFEDTLNACRMANGETAYKLGDKATMGLLTAYARTLSDGMKMNIKVEGPGALKAYEDGKKTYYARSGQLNFSCANCHVDNVGNKLRSETLHMAVGASTHWPVFRGGDNLVTLQARYERCFAQVRHVSEPIGSEKLNNLEYFHSYISNGLEMRASVFRK
jgi:L-cysteine S-thiosulfotransferase